MIEIAVCDDNNYYCGYIKNIIDKYMKSHADIAFNIDTYSSGKELIGLGIAIQKYQITFLDINMDDIDGLETARNIRKYSDKIYIVFITAFYSYSLGGYEVEAIRYILKNDKLEKAIYECLKTILHKMISAIEPVKIKFSFIDGKKAITISTILYVESNLHKLEFWIMEAELKSYKQYGKLDDIDKALSAYGFIRIHKSYLVNIKQIRNVLGNKAILRNGIELSISKSQYKKVKESFIEYNGDI